MIRAALEASKNSFDETVETLNRYTGAEIGKRQVEQLVSRAAQDFDAFYEQRHHQAAADQAAEGQSAEEPPAEEPRAATDALAAAAVLVITSDAKGVVMHQQDLRPATRKASERTPRSKLNTRLTLSTPSPPNWNALRHGSMSTPSCSIRSAATLLAPPPAVAMV